MDMKEMGTVMVANWNRLGGAIKEQWGNLTDDDILAFEGKTERIANKLLSDNPEKYANLEEAMEDAQKLFDELTK